MTEYVVLYGKKYPKSLIKYVLEKYYDGRTINDLKEKYLDDMKQVVKDSFHKGVRDGKLYTFYPTMIPVWQDIAEAKGYMLTNIKYNPNSGTYTMDVVKVNTRKPKKKIIKSQRKK